MTVLGEWAVSALIRSRPEWVAAGLAALPVSNDEGDPMVGWEKPEDWRGDARYAAIIPKMVAQHAAAIGRNASGALNPLGWLSFDGAFMNGVDDTYTGFGQRTMTARFGAPEGSGAAPFAFVRKSGLAAFALLARLPEAAACAVALGGGGGGAGVLHDNAGALAAADAAAGDAALLVYNSADCAAGDGAGALDAALSLAGLPFAPAAVAAGAPVGVPYWVDDDAARSPYAAWLAQGAPAAPAPAQLKALWAAAAAMGAAAAAPVPLALRACAAPAAGFCVALPRVNASGAGGGALPLPGLLLWHVALRPAAPPPAPAAPAAFAKAPAASFLAADEREVLLRWDCSAAPRTVLAYVVQFSGDGGGSWAAANAPPYPADALCSFAHAAPAASASLRYRVAAVDYWARQSGWSAEVEARAWPVLY